MLVPVSGPVCSVVVPVYNRPTTLTRAVRSALSQTVAEVEVIVVDDASSEPVVLSGEFGSDSRVCLFRRSENGGVAAAQNTGLAAASGRFVAFLHSDDEWLPDKLATQIEALDQSSASVVESATRRLLPDAERVVPARSAGVGHDEIVRREVRNLHIAGFLFDRAFLDGLEGFDEQLRSYEDFDMLVRVTSVTDVCVTDDVVAVVDQRGADRLADSPWMPRARRLLIDKYERELIDRYGEFPAVWKDWALRDALDLIDEGQIDVARRRVRRSIGRDPRRALRRLPLEVATLFGRGPSSVAARRYRSHLAHTRASLTSVR